jgi:L-ascorbate metabolism protein UlaG (beta-lactamase superfamily)
MPMKITKYVHACLLVETADRAALFDPGVMSAQALPVDSLEKLDDIFITHIHSDHVSPELLKRLIAKFPTVRITAPKEVVTMLSQEGINASTTPPAGVEFFDSPHEKVEPLFPQPEEIGIHYLGKFTDPGDSHSFKETKAILALPVTAPWGSSIRAINLALELKPQHVVPIHDWHWSDEAREQTYDRFEKVLGEHDITFHKLQTGVPVDIAL